MRQPLLVLALVASLPLLEAAASPLEAGRFEALSGNTGVLVAAPHGGFDLHSDAVARQVALATGAGYVLASGFRTPAHPWNVNRPTEGVGLPADQEPRTADAQAVYDAYLVRVMRQSPRLYVEIHGNSRAQSAGWIEVATVNIPDEAALAFQASFRRRVAALGPAFPQIDLRIEPFDTLHYQATGAKRHGILRLAPRTVHLELPRALRMDERVRSRYAWTIAQSLDDLVRRLPE